MDIKEKQKETLLISLIRSVPSTCRWKRLNRNAHSNKVKREPKGNSPYFHHQMETFCGKHSAWKCHAIIRTRMMNGIALQADSAVQTILKCYAALNAMQLRQITEGFLGGNLETANRSSKVGACSFHWIERHSCQGSAIQEYEALLSRKVSFDCCFLLLLCCACACFMLRFFRSLLDQIHCVVLAVRSAMGSNLASSSTGSPVDEGVMPGVFLPLF